MKRSTFADRLLSLLDLCEWHGVGAFGYRLYTGYSGQRQSRPPKMTGEQRRQQYLPKCKTGCKLTPEQKSRAQIGSRIGRGVLSKTRTTA